MSILIKGMEMPPTCRYCAFRHLSISGNAFCTAANETIDYMVERTKRLDNCPLIEVPPHGRLIDADALSDAIELIDWYHQNKNKGMVEGANSDEEQAWYREQDIYAAIEDAPTIIEAEPDCATCPVKGKACKVFYRDKGDLSVCRELRKVEGEE